MKKTKKFLIVFSLMVCISVLLVACTAKDADGLIKLDTPTNVRVQGDAISWDSVENASKYFLSVEGIENEIEVHTTSYTLKVEQVGSFHIKVRAYGDGQKYGTSDFSEEVVLIKRQTIKTPEVSVNENGLVEWKAVENATSYYVTIKNRDKALVKQFSTTELSYDMKNDADKDLYKNPNAYSIVVKAMANPEDLTHRDSLESTAVKYIVKGQLNIPKFSKITTSVIWWNTVDDEIKKVDKTLNVKYEIKLDYSENGENKSDTYITTQDNIGLTSLKMPVAGEYKVSIRAIGDEVYESSAFSTPTNEFNLIKLPEINKDDITFKQENLGGVLKWTVPSIDNIGRFNVVLETYKADGSKSLTASEYVAVKYTNPAEGEEKQPILEYSYNIQDLFYDPLSGDKLTPNKTEDEYYGRTYKISVIAVKDSKGDNSSNRIIDSEKTTIDTTYSNYIKPIVSEGNIYQINTMSNFAYIRQEPSANYAINTDIDFRGYAFDPIPEFTGKLYGKDHTLKNFVINGVEGTENLGIFGVNKGLIENLFFNNLKVSYDYAAKNIGLVAAVNEGSIHSVYVTGDTVAHQYNKSIEEKDKIVAENVGGLVAINKGSIEDAVTNVKVKGNVVGGLVAINNGTISFSYAIGQVDALANQKTTEIEPVIAGGLVGINEKIDKDVLILLSFADNKVRAVSNKINSNAKAGGLVGINGANCIIKQSYAGGMYSRNVTTKVEVVSSATTSYTGGFVAENAGLITSSYTTLKAVATSYSAGFAAVNSGTIENSYCAGGVGNSGSVGGFVSDNKEGATVTNCFYTRPNKSFGDEGSQAGTLIEEKDIATLAEKLGNSFGKFDEKPAPVLKGMIYLPEYNLKVRSQAVGTYSAKIVNTDGKVVEIYSDPGKPESFKYLGEAKRGETIRAKFILGGVYIQVLVTIK